MKSKIIIIVFALIALAAGFGVSLLLSKNPEQGHVQIQGSVLPVPRQIAVPDLVKHDGTAFTNADIQGNWTLVFFGYTHCPDICPTTMAVLAQAKKKAEGPFPNVMMVSVDPERDTVELLREYVKYFDPAFIGVTGDEKMIQALTIQTSVVYMKMEGASGKKEDYLVDHSSQILLINPEGQLAAFLMAPHSPQSILDSVNAVIESS
jgi:protein SCO1/2